jgi:beta-lactamase regulating signal transducer with metallopeptidase domain
MLVRLALRRAPKAVSYGLWFVVLFRLICPVSFKSAVSLFGPASSLVLEQMPVMTGASGAGIAATANPAGFEPATVSPAVSTGAASPAMALSVTAVLALLWAAGVLALLVYGVVSYLKTTRRVRTATLVEGNIYESDRITGPFVAGFIHPKIFLPVSLKDGERNYIVLHEQTHIRRRDYIVKPLWFLAVCLHWFNPLAWMSYFLLGRDMEMSCDEAVIRRLGDGIRADYSSSCWRCRRRADLLPEAPGVRRKPCVLAH